MKAVLQFATSMAAAGLLLAGAASHATSIAELPLKASVLAKPNVIFGLDDSGSMDSELMLNTNDGAFWWDYNAATGWDGTGKPHFNSVGDASTQWRKMVYLFPNGTGTGNRVYSDSTNDHFAIMPTPQFAWLRWSGGNPLYYNPSITYDPWSPAYVGGAKVTYGNASKSAAKSHPVYGTGTVDLSATRAASQSAENVFMALPGMKVPAGSKTCNHTNCSTWTTEATERTVPANTILRVAMDYWPATYYVKTTCTVASDGSCVNAPTGGTLRRVEIRSSTTSYAYNKVNRDGTPMLDSSGVQMTGARTYADELQNFANWFTYYRKRKLMLNAAIGQVLEPLTGLRMGVVHFNNRTTPTMYDIDSLSASTNGLKVAGIFYETNGSGGTPTRETLKHIGDQYASATGPVQYACQRNNAFIVTDGFANATTVTPPSYTSATFGSGAPYATTYAGTLADIALSYYTNNLRTSFTAGRVPATTTDTNVNLHMNTYGLTLGARGTLFAGETSTVPTSTTAWPNPTANRNPSAVDDLWHATINGRGKMYLADTPEETSIRIQAGLTDILSARGAQGGIAVSTVNLSRGDSRAYFGTYNPSGWAGDLTANPVNVDTGSVNATTELWSGAKLLAKRDWSTRTIATQNTSGTGMAFTVANVASIVNPGGVYGTDEAVVNYLRGSRAGEGVDFRARTSLMGAIINSEPAVDRDEGVVYVASGEGMLHAFETKGANAGKELWAFVPRQVLNDIGESTERGYAFRVKLDGSPVIGKTGTSSKLLVAGYGASGRGYYAIDVSSPRDLDDAGLAGKVRWEFPSAGDTTTQSKMGQTLGRPIIVKTASGYVVMVTSGYNNTYDGKGRLWVLNPSDGSVLKEYVTADGSLASEAGLTHVSPFGEADGTVQYVYGGDLLGNLWRFDVSLAATSPDAVKKVAVLKGPTGATQPVTTPVELVSYKSQRIVFVGTGRLLDIGDFGSSLVQTMYGIADGSLLSNARSSLVTQTYTAASDTVTTNTVDWTTQRGWYLDLPAGQQANTRPTIAYGALAFVANLNGGSDCTAKSWLYVVNLLTGSKFSGTDYVSSLISSTSSSSGVTALVTSGQKIVGAGQNADGLPWDRTITNGVPIVPAKNAWRELRR